ncbi:MAG: PH domain-containing protein [Verrucomicrobiales bacterium]
MEARWNTKFYNYELTNERLKLSTGVLNRKTDVLELYRVKDMELEKPLHFRIFGLEPTDPDHLRPDHRPRWCSTRSGRATMCPTRSGITSRRLRDKKRVREVDFEGDDGWRRMVKRGDQIAGGANPDTDPGLTRQTPIPPRPHDFPSSSLLLPRRSERRHVPDLAEVHASARDLFSRADDILGFSLTGAMFDGPEGELTRPRAASPRSTPTVSPASPAARAAPEPQPAAAAGFQ